MKKQIQSILKNTPSVSNCLNLLILLLFSINNVWSQQLTINQFTGTGACPTAGNSFSAVTNATVAAMSRNTATCTSANNVFNSTTLNNTASRSNTSYIEFSITASSGFALNLSSLSFFRQGSNSAPNSLVVSYSTDAANFNTTRVDMATSTTAASGTVLTWTFPTAIATTDGGTVTFRFYPFGTTSVSGAVAASTGTFRIDDVTLFGTVNSASPTLSVAPTSVSNLSYILGNGPSTAGNYVLTGSSLTGNITLTAPTNFEISELSPIMGFNNTIPISPISGSITNKTIYARLISGLAVNAYSGNITHTGGGLASTVNVPLSGSVSLTALPNISINDVNITEGNSGTTNLTFTVSLSTPAPAGGVNFDIATSNATATAPTDYVAKTLTAQNIPEGSSSTTFDVVINGDGTVEANETFNVTLSNVTNANITDATGIGTITNDDIASNITKISAIQGSGATAAFTDVRTIEAIVTRTFLGATGLSGFYVQEEDADTDNDVSTSEGIFIYDINGLFTGNAGDKVQITGTASEFVSSASSLTQMSALTSVLVVSSGNTLPTISNIQFPVTNVADLERYEGMLVNASATTGNLVVTEHYQLGRFGQVVLSAMGASNQTGTDARLDQYTQFNAPSVSGYTAYLAEIAKRRIYLDDGRGVQNPDPIIFGRGGNPLSASNTLRGGDEVASITAILDHRFEGYRLQTATGVNFQATNARPASTPTVAGTLKVASFNILNYFNGPSFPTSRGADNAAEFTRQRNKTVQAILLSGVDVFGLNELQDNGYGASSAIQDLVSGVNAIAGAGTYTLINSGDVSDDEITVGMIYKTSKVTPVGAAAAIPFTFGTGSFNVVNRRALAQTFSEISTGEKFTFVVNHFKSKGSSSGGAGDADENDGQALSNGTRTRQAQDLLGWLATNPTGTTDPDYLVAGDLNAYAQETPLTTLATGGFTSVLPNTSSSYVFDGQVGSLDHALANSTLRTQVAGALKWSINADEPNVLDYNTEFKTVGLQASLYNADQFRTSDHDPVIVGLNLTSAVLPVELIDFKAIPFNQNIKLEWSTASEINNSHFEIERSADGKVFEKMSRIKSKGNGQSSKQTYNFIDENPHSPINYYRLKMVDLDSSFHYSKTISVNLTHTIAVKVYPNPAKNVISVEPFNTFKSLIVYNLQGIALLKSTQTQVDISSISAGIYFIEIESTEGLPLRVKFVKE